jgi:hypothetical protein
VIAVLIAAGVMVGLVNISSSERVSHYSHPRPEVERNDRDLHLFMVVPKTKYGSPAKKANSAAVSTEKADAKKSEHHKTRAGFNGGY